MVILKIYLDDYKENCDVMGGNYIFYYLISRKSLSLLV